VSFKKIEDMDHYEILNVKKSASQEEIQRAYRIGISSYSPDSMAHYTLLSEEEREEMLIRIERAFQVLGDPESRREYDEKTLHRLHIYRDKTYFRQSIERMVIEDASTGQQWVENLKRFFFSSKKQ
jgi:DnaJ-class molecular chaperone